MNEYNSSPTWCTVCEEKRVTQLKPAPMCDSCWADKCSIQNIGGELKHFKQVLKDKLVEMDLWFKDGETKGEWLDRMEVDGRATLQRLTGRKKS